MRLILTLASAAVLFAANAIIAGEATGEELVLRRITQELLDAVAPGDRAVWERHLDETVIHIDENGDRRTKAELVAQIEPLPPGLRGRLTVASFAARISGDVAVTVHEDQEELDYFGQSLRSGFRSLDTWRRTPKGWRLIGMHVAAVLAFRSQELPSTASSQARSVRGRGIGPATRETSATSSNGGSGRLQLHLGSRPFQGVLAEIDKK
jgi:hypothetical protein